MNAETKFSPKSLEPAEARTVFFNAYAEAKRFDDDHIHTEHLLLGILKEEDNTACRILRELGISFTRIHEEVERHRAERYGRMRLIVPLTPRARNVLDMAVEEAIQLQHRHIGSEHILIALLRDEEGLACRVLGKVGVDLNAVRTLIAQTSPS